MKNILKISPDSGAKTYNVVNKDKDNVYVHNKRRIDIDPSLSVAGDIAFYDKDNDKVIIVSQSNWSITDYPADKFEPIGVVVVPGTHNVYDDSSCGVISLKAMYYGTPAIGYTKEFRMKWGPQNADIYALPGLTQTPSGNTENGIPTDQAPQSYLPSDKCSGLQCAHDTDVFYYTTSSDDHLAPSPYLTDGSRNPGYYQTTSPLSSDNALADFNGRGNTDKIIAFRGDKDYTSWKPGQMVDGDCPAASCCDMFYTDGTQQGDWYLPACGELGYLMPSFNKINDAITQMQNVYGSSVGVKLSTDGDYWSSSKYDKRCAREISTSKSAVFYEEKTLNSFVRAFLRVNADGVVRS